ncbi:MAG: copper resistance protein B [Casimicrobiaceae bacterium]
MKSSSRQPQLSALTLGLSSLLLVALPSWAAAQSADHAHMQSMPDMQMPMQPATKKPPPKKNAASTANSRKPSCEELVALGKQASKQYLAQCTKQPKQSGKGKKTAPSAMNHSQMEHTDASGMETMNGMDHSTMPAMDHSKMQQSGMEGMDHSSMQGSDHSRMEGMDHSQMDMGAMNMQGGPPPPDARDPDYSDGIAHQSMRGMDMNDDASLLYVLFDNLEYRHSGDGNAQAVDAQAWYGGDRNKLWLKLDGERSDGRLGATRTEALWNHAIATYWGSQIGMRHDLGDGPSRNWAAFGVQGLAPYWFDLQATAYLGQSRRTALRVEAEYELLLTQRWILQPDVEINFYGKNDHARGIGSGLSDLDFGLRLRYEITRKLAPYVGVVWNRKFGNTADYARAVGGDNQETQLVAGFRIWF